MNLYYYEETDSLYIDLGLKPGADVREIAEGVVVDFDKDGRITGIDIDNASKKIDLSTLKVEDLPVAAKKRTKRSRQVEHVAGSASN